MRCSPSQPRRSSHRLPVQGDLEVDGLDTTTPTRRRHLQWTSWALLRWGRPGSTARSICSSASTPHRSSSGWESEHVGSAHSGRQCCSTRMMGRRETNQAPSPASRVWVRSEAPSAHWPRGRVEGRSGEWQRCFARCRRGAPSPTWSWEREGKQESPRWPSDVL